MKTEDITNRITELDARIGRAPLVQYRSTNPVRAISRNWSPTMMKPIGRLLIG